MPKGRSSSSSGKEKKAKRQKKKHKHSHQKIQRDSSISQRSRSKSRERDLRNQQKESFKDDTHHPNREIDSKPSNSRRLKVNSNLLAHIISDQKKINRKLDTQQTQRAASKFNQNFTGSIQPVTMSAFLSNQSLQKRIMDKQASDGSCLVCGQKGCDIAEHRKYGGLSD